MGEVIWLEVLGRHREVVSRHRVGGAPFAIGRGYDNDLVLDDPAVAPRHVVIARDATGGEWVAEDQGSLNGIFVEGDRAPATRVRLARDTVLRLGRTLVRVRDAAYPVAPERRLEPQARRPALLPALAAAALAAVLAEQWAGETAPSEGSKWLLAVLGSTLLVASWSGAWALASRLFAGHALYPRHLAVALAGFLALYLADDGWALAAYALRVPMPATAVAALQWALFGALCYAHLRVIGPGHLRVKAASGIAVALAAFGLQFMGSREMERYAGAEAPVPRLFPPALRVVPGIDEEAFFARVGERREALDRARQEEVAPGLFGGLAEDDER